MNTVAQIIREKRRDLEVSLDEISLATKIPKNQLLSLEKGNWRKFNSFVYLQGVVKKTANYLKLDSAKMILYLKREIEQEKPDFIRKTNYQNHRQFLLANWPVYLLIFVVILFFGLQWFFSWQKPLLEVSSIPKSIKINQFIKIEGKVEPGAILYLNDEAIYQDENGFFSERLFFKNAGERKLVIRAIGVNGKEQIYEQKVIIKN
jgi:hypothetical protein